MRRRRANRVVGVAWLAALAAAAGCAGDVGPHLDSASPSAAARNATVDITGRRLCGESGNCANAAGEVEIGLEPPMVRAVIVSYSDTDAQIVVPPSTPVGHTALIVVVDERSSNALDFEVLP